MKKILPSIALVLAFILVIGMGSVATASTSAPASGIMGDSNGDGNVTSSDIALLLRQVLGEGSISYQQSILEDTNHDGYLTSSDATLMLRYMLYMSNSCELVETKTTKDGLYSFTAQDNMSTINAYLGAATVLQPFPTAMEGHVITTIAAGAFTNSGVTEIWFVGAPISGLPTSGLSSTCKIHYPTGQGWESAGLSSYFTNTEAYDYVPTPVTVTVSNTTVTYDGRARDVTVSASPAIPYYISYVDANGQSAVPINAGTYTYTIEFTQSGYAAAANGSGTFTIEKANYPAPIFVGATVHRADDEGEEQHRLYATSIPQGVSVTYVYYNSTAPTVPLSTDYASDVGTYYVYANYTHSNPNYNQLAKQGATLVIKSPWSEGFMSDQPQG